MITGSLEVYFGAIQTVCSGSVFLFLPFYSIA